MQQLFLFCDGSVQAKSGRGCGAYLLAESLQWPLTDLAARIATCEFEQTSSTRLELQVLLHVLSAMPAQQKVTVFTDSQNIIDLPRRRARLQEQGFCSKQGRRLNNADLYQRFFELWDRLALDLVKVRGHSPSAEKSKVEQIFALVDIAARQHSRQL